MQSPFFSASDLRAKARQAIRTNPSTLLMVMFLASLPGLISSTINAIAQGTSGLTNYIYLISMSINDSTANLEQLQSSMEQAIFNWLQSPPAIAALAVKLITELITPVLSLGLIAALLKVLRGGAAVPADVFMRGSCFFKAIGLKLYTFLKLLLWMVPGMIVSILSVFVLIWSRSTWAYLALFFAGLGLMLVLGIRAALHYSLAEQVLADTPEVGIRSALRGSIKCMRTRKMAFASLYLSFIGWILLSDLIESMMSSISPVLGLVAGMVCSLLLNLYMNMSFAAFYMQEYLHEQPAFTAAPTKEPEL